MLRLFCKHKNERILYEKDDECIYYCPDCKGYSRVSKHKYLKKDEKTKYRSNPGDISNFKYLGGNK